MNLKLDKSATYRIRVVGHLNSSWSDRLGGMTITQENQNKNHAGTTLHGQLPDQAALFGVLVALYDMHLPLISVECLDANP